MKRTIKTTILVLGALVLSIMASGDICAGTIADAEYYFDNDPPQAIAPVDGVFDEPFERFNFTIAHSLSEGPHTLYFRVKDSDDNWGIPRRFDFNVYLENTRKIIIAAEYFIDSVLGPGQGTPMLPSDSTFDEPAESAFIDGISTADLDTGSHLIYVHFKDNYSYWPANFCGWGPLKCETLVVVNDSVGIKQDEDIMPGDFLIAQNYPNPFNAQTQIKYALPEASHVLIEIFDLLGRRVATVVNQDMPAGYHETTWNTQGISSGVYFYTIRAGDFVDMKKMILLK
jgi:hypothetical protein